MEVTYIGPRRTMGGKIPTLSKQAAEELITRHGIDFIPAILWLCQGIDSGNRQLTICDYRPLAGYADIFACAIYDGAGNMLERFNVKP